MTKACRAALFLTCLTALAGCGRYKEVRMVDPRSGVTATCKSDRYNVLTTNTVVQEVNACIQELTYYGFQDEDALLAAAKGK